MDSRDGAVFGREPWLEDIAQIFQPRRGQTRLAIDVGTCPNLANLIGAGLARQSDVGNFELLGLFSEVLLAADTGEQQPRGGTPLVDLRYRRADREGIRGYLFIGRDVQDSGLPVLARDVRALSRRSNADPRKINVELKSVRLRWAITLENRSLQEARSERVDFAVPDSARGYEPRPRYQARLTADLRAFLSSANAQKGYVAKYFGQQGLGGSLANQA
jgi:hypothetical protein